MIFPLESIRIFVLIYIHFHTISFSFNYFCFRFEIVSPETRNCETFYILPTPTHEMRKREKKPAKKLKCYLSHVQNKIITKEAYEFCPLCLQRTEKCWIYWFCAEIVSSWYYLRVHHILALCIVVCASFCFVVVVYHFR